MALTDTKYSYAPQQQGKFFEVSYTLYTHNFMHRLYHCHDSKSPYPVDLFSNQKELIQAMDISGREYLTVDPESIYAPYFPLYETPTLNTSELMSNNGIIPANSFSESLRTKKKEYLIKNYNDIYSDIKDRFKILDL